MPFGTITAQTLTYEPRTPGTYVRSTVTFGSPSNEFRIRGGTVSKDGLIRTSISRVLEKDVTVGSQVVRRSVTLTCSIVTPSADFTAAEIDSLFTDVSEFITATTVSRMLQGES